MSFAMSLVGLFSTPLQKSVVSPRYHSTGRLNTGSAPLQSKFEPGASALFARGERMLRAARRHGQVLSMLVLQLADLPELESLFGREAADAVVADVMTELARISGRRGFVARTQDDTFALLAPSTTSEELRWALQSRLGRACAIELELEEEDILVVPDVQVRTIALNETIHDAYSIMCRVIVSERHIEEHRQLHLRREREARTIPMELMPATPVARRIQPGTHSPIAATIPVPLGS